MFNWLASLINRWPAAILLVAVIFVGVAALFGTRVFGALTGQDPASQSVKADGRLEVASRQRADGGLISLVRMGQDVNSPSVREKVDRVAHTIARDPAVDQVLTTTPPRAQHLSQQMAGVRSCSPTSSGSPTATRRRAGSGTHLPRILR